MKIIFGFFFGALFVAGIDISHAMTAHHFSTDSFVRMFERHEGIAPGETRTMPECGCTMLYRGTEVSGNHYKVFIDKLD